MKHIPNILSLLRLILSAVLAAATGHKTEFLFLYIICGMTDVLDGFLARKYHWESKTGAVLDSIGDFFMFGAAAYAFYFWMGGFGLNTWLAIGLIILLRIAGMLISAIKYGRPYLLHTYANKATGALLFLAVPSYLLTASVSVFIPLLILAFYSAVEEILIHLKFDSLELNRKSLFERFCK